MTSTAPELEFYRTAERPDLQLWLHDEDDALVDFTSGYTFEWKLSAGVVVGTVAVFTKDTGITGAAGSGTDASGTPNVTLTFAAGELEGLAAGFYVWQLRARAAGDLDRIYQGRFTILEVIE